MKDYVIEWEWEDHVQAGKITVKWIMKLAMWSVIIAYLPNIIWYFAGYPADAILMRCIVMAVGLPAVVFFGMKSYRMQYTDRPLAGHVQIYEDHIQVNRVMMSESFREYDTVWKAAASTVKKINFDMGKGFIKITALYHIEAYKNRPGAHVTSPLMASDFTEEELEIQVPENKAQDLALFLEKNHRAVSEIRRREESTDGKEI